MKKIMVSCLLVLAVAIPVQAISLNSDQVRTVPREMSGTMEGRFTFTGPWEGPWTTAGNITGTLSHLGLSKMYTTHTADPDGTISGATFKIVAANDDEIQGTYVASAEWTPDYAHVQGTAILSIEGGTGRFAHVQGTITAIFLETFDDQTYASAKVTWVLEGTIKY